MLDILRRMKRRFPRWRVVCAHANHHPWLAKAARSGRAGLIGFALLGIQTVSAQQPSATPSPDAQAILQRALLVRTPYEPKIAIETSEQWLKETREKMAATCEAAKKVIASAAQDGRLKEPAITFLRARLDRIAAHPLEFQGSDSWLRITPRVPRLEELDAALDRVEQIHNESRASFTHREEAYRGAERELRRLTEQGTKPSDVTRLRRYLAFLRELTTADTSDVRRVAILEWMTENLEALFDAFQKKDFAAMDRVFVKLPDQYPRFIAIGTTSWEANYVRNRLLGEEVAKVQAVFEEAVLSRKPKTDCQKRMRELEQLILRVSLSEKYSPYFLPMFTQERIEETLALYREVLTDLPHAEGRGIGPVLAPKARLKGETGLTASAEFKAFAAELLAKRPKQKDEQRDAVVVALEEQRLVDWVAEQLAAARTPEDLLRLIDLLPKADAETNPGETGVRWSVVRSDLSRIARWWVRGWGNQTFPFARLGDSPKWVEPLDQLSWRATREILAKHVDAPELLQPPLAELPLSEAVQRIAEAAGQKGDWIRVQRLWGGLAPLILRAEDQRVIRDRRDAVTNFLAAQHMEAAGCYREAVQAYRQTFARTERPLPSKEAGERLEALRKTHPEAFESSAPQ